MTFIVASPEDGIFYDKAKQHEVDIDEQYEISNIKEIIYDHEEGFFYLLANKYQEKLGFFVLKINKDVPQINKKSFLIKQKNKMDIGDANMFVLRNKRKGIKEVIISYKTIYINTFNITCMDT